MSISILDKLSKLFHNTNKENPLFVKVGGKKRFGSGWYRKIIRDIAAEVCRMLSDGNYTQKQEDGSNRGIRVFVSRDWEIDRLKKLKKEEEENRLPHPVEKQ